jgi:hypothetical protein
MGYDDLRHDERQLMRQAERHHMQKLKKLHYVLYPSTD